ncbi:MAG: hypothetical protein Q8P49_02090 [Candidatus Liptonbacteria bacterium]|nr:hypothetical protein [Candidatus Liptonbacteria bacterium]
MLDFKKLITGFLILAAIVSSSAFALSDILGGRTAKTADQVAQISAWNAQNDPSVPANAFVETIPDSQNTLALAPSTEPTSDEEGLPVITPTTNFTQSIVQIMTREVVSANPEGPQQDENGQVSVATPDINALFGKLSQTPAAASIKIPDWDKEAAAEKISVIPGADKNDLVQYGNAVSNALNAMLIASSFPNIKINSTGDVAPLASAVDAAFENIRAVPVPQSAISFHKSLLTMLVYERGAFGIVKNAASDPVKASLILQAEEKKFNLALLNLQNESQKVKGFQIILSVGNENRSGTLTDMIGEIFGVKTAHAQYFTTFDAWTVAKSIWRTLMITLQNLAKNIIVNTFQQGILNWVRGGGKPLFITNWKSFLQNAANQAAGAAIGQLAPGFCSSFGPLLRIALSSGGGPYNGYYSSCTLTQVVGNITAFYNNFQNGGWISYTTLFQGDNNIFAAAIDSRRFIASEAREARAAANNEGIASKGFLSMKKCPPSATLTAGGICYDPANGGTWTQPVNTTPGDVVSSQVNKALHANQENTTNQPIDPDSWAGILSLFIGNLVDALLTKGAGLL